VIRVVIHLGLAGVLLLVPCLLIVGWTVSARTRLAELELSADEAPVVATASAAEVGYCSPELKKVLRRVLQSCGLLSSGEVRGCQPLEAKNVATVSGDDFNALFMPMAERAGIIQFDRASAELDEGDSALLDEVFADQRGGSYFFVVSRASPDGSEIANRQLSQDRGEAVLDHLRTRFDDPDLDKEVGLLWLGEEYAQLDKQFCEWRRSGDEGCRSSELNRSAFVAWIDCRL
jgi:outer membrane protein OmpA-like peptidoglycan-associated protein